MSLIKVLRVEKKFGKSLGQILRDLASQDLSVREIAERTTFSQPVVGRMLQELGLTRERDRPTQARIEAGRKAGKAGTRYLVEYEGERGSIPSICRPRGISVSRVYRAIWDGIEPQRALEMAVGGGE